MRHTILIIVAGLLIMASCNQTTTTTTTAKTDSTATTVNKQDRNKQVIMASMDGLTKHDVGMLMKDVTPDFMDYGDGSQPPMKKDSAMSMMKSFFNAFPDITYSNPVYLTGDDYVAVYATWTGTFKNDMMGMKATGKSFNYKDVDIFKLTGDGKIMEHRNIMPGSVMMMQVGGEMPKMKSTKK